MSCWNKKETSKEMLHFENQKLVIILFNFLGVFQKELDNIFSVILLKTYMMSWRFLFKQ